MTMKEKKEVVQLLTPEKAKRENSAVVAPLKKDVSAVSWKAGEQIGAPATSLEQIKNKVDILKKEKAALAHDLHGLRNCKECAKYERGGLEVKLQRAQREREKCVDAVNRLQSGVNDLQGLVKKGFDDLLKHMEEQWVKMSQHLSTLLAERFVKDREDQIRESRGVAALYVHDWENLLKGIRQLV